MMQNCNPVVALDAAVAGMLSVLVASLRSSQARKAKQYSRKQCLQEMCRPHCVGWDCNSSGTLNWAKRLLTRLEVVVLHIDRAPL